MPSRPAKTIARVLAATLVAAIWCAPAAGQLLLDDVPEEARGLEVTERLGQRIPLGLRFTDSEGEEVELREYFDGEKPVVLAMVYYDCPIVCPLVLDKMAQRFDELDFTIGEDFNVVVVSFDFTNTVSMAKGKKVLYVSGYDRAADGRVRNSVVESGWGFHVGDAENIRQLGQATGFPFNRLPSGEYAHPLAIMVLTPDGALARYIYGLEYDADQLRYSLLEASEGRIAESLGDVVAFLCYQWDPSAGAYTLQAFAVMRIAGVLTVIGLAAFIGGLFLNERIKRSRVSARAEETTHAEGTPATA